MKRKSVSASTGGMLGADARTNAALDARPNVLVIVADQHNAKLLSCKHHPDVRTPNLDRLAQGGVRFDNAISQNPICTPSRVSFLSGQYCHNHGYYGLSGPRPNGLPSVIGHFRRAGYRTAAIGKIHCPEYWIEDDSDVFHDTCGTSVGGRSSKYADYLEERKLTLLEDHGAMQELGKRGQQTCEGRPSKVSYDDGQEGWSVREAIAFMDGCSHQNIPFFAFVSLPKPHQCYTPAQQFWDLYSESKLTLPPNADSGLKLKAPNLIETAKHWRTGKWTLFEPRTFEAGRLRKLHGYLGNVSHVDHAVGQLLDWLEKTKLDESTIVVYLSDHGDYVCEQGIMEKAPGICADAITRVPFIWSWKGRFKSGHVATELVELVDMPNTLCALAELETPNTADGKDISPLLQGKRAELHRIAVTEFPLSRSVRKGQYRCVLYARELFAAEYPDGFGELYDLEADPWEMQNRYFTKRCADVVRDMKDEFTDWLLATTRPVTFHPPVVTHDPQSVVRYSQPLDPDGKVNPERMRQASTRNYL